MINNSVSFDQRASRPFVIGTVTEDNRFVHVFDEMSVDILMRELDTISDFLKYLDAREELIGTTRRAIVALGEEELLAEYLSNGLRGGEPRFRDLPESAKTVLFGEGSWVQLSASPGYAAHKARNTVSYLWDSLIEYHAQYVRDGTAVSGTPEGEVVQNTNVADHEWIVRALASEPRTYRCQLSSLFREAVEVNEPEQRFARMGIFGHRSDRAYVFLIVPVLRDQPYDEYRRQRSEYLLAYCQALKLRYPQIAETVGIASEPRVSEAATLDFSRIEHGPGPLSDELRVMVEEMCREMEILDPNAMREWRP